MQTHRETILQAVVTRLGTSTPVYRSRVEALDRDELPAIVVRPGNEQSQRLGNGVVRRAFQILIEVHARADSGRAISADQSADAVIAALHAALYAEKTLGGILADLTDREMQEPQFADGDETRVGITLVLEALYATNEKDITNLTNH